METVGAPGVWTRQTAIGEKRDLWSAMKRGFRGRCPRCGEGKLFRAFLKTANNCSVCGLDFTPHRADDLPAYLVIVIVGHIVARGRKRDGKRDVLKSQRTEKERAHVAGRHKERKRRKQKSGKSGKGKSWKR